MIRFLFKLILCVLLALAAGFGYLTTRSGDAVYTFYEWMSPARFHQYDPLIRSIAMKHHLDPMLIKAVVWRENRFDPRKYGGGGGSRRLVFASGVRALESAIGPDALCAGGIQCRRQPGAALERWRYGERNTGAKIPSEHRFSRNAEVCRVDHRAPRILQAPRAHVAKDQVWRQRRIFLTSSKRLFDPPCSARPR